jgi:putative serine protease PepD
VVTIAASGPGGAGTGSGEVIRSGGYVLTNNHVILPAASGGSVGVLFADGQTAPATITGRDPQTDLAVLKVETSRQLKLISLGSSSSVKVGQPVVAVGAPLGLSGTVTSGIISALDRTVEVPGENDRNALLVSAVQTDASINPGNSGGALVNCEGQLVGGADSGRGGAELGWGQHRAGFCHTGRSGQARR